MKRIITISREFGSGGHSIGQKVAEKLKLHFYDQALLEKIAQETGLSKEYIENSEYALARNSLLFNIAVNRSLTNYAEPSPADVVYFAQTKIIQEIAEKESCVIVGRCADAVLRSAGIPAASLFICAPFEDRVRRRMEIESIGHREAEDAVRKIDKQRKKYYDTYTGRSWGAPENYDLCINSSVSGIEGTAEQIIIWTKCI